MPERRVGFIPSATFTGQERLAVFVTDQRTIVINDDGPTPGFLESMKQLFGAQADQPPAPRPIIDYATVDIQSLASAEGSQVIPHSSILEGRIGKGIGGYGVWLKIEGQDMKKDYLVLSFTAPRELVKKRKAEGISRRTTVREYERKCVEVFRRALPPLISEKVEWKS